MLVFLPAHALGVTYVDHALSQYAGEIGLVSAGLGRQFGRYSISILYGMTPREISAGPLIETIALRQTWSYYKWKNLELHVGLNVFHALGLQYDHSRFRDTPDGYYSFGSVRGILYLGSSLRLGRNSRQSVYFEGGLNDVWITNWASNQESVNPFDHVSLALGVKSEF